MGAVNQESPFVGQEFVEQAYGVEYNKTVARMGPEITGEPRPEPTPPEPPVLPPVTDPVDPPPADDLDDLDDPDDFDDPDEGYEGSPPPPIIDPAE